MNNEPEYRLAMAGDDYVDYQHELERLNALMLTSARSGCWTSYYWRLADKYKLIEKMESLNGGSENGE